MTELRKARARTLARRSRAQDHRSGADYLVFRLANEWHGLPVADIREILKPPQLTPVPRAPRSVLGIVSVRGQIVTVLDLRRKLDLTEAPASHQTRVLLVGATSGETLGLFVDEVLQVLHLAEAEVERTNTTLGDAMAEYIAGIARPKAASEADNPAKTDTMIILLDLKAVLSDAT